MRPHENPIYTTITYRYTDTVFFRPPSLGWMLRKRKEEHVILKTTTVKRVQSKNFNQKKKAEKNEK